MGLNGTKRPKTKNRGEIMAALDVGTSKIVCFIARVDGDGTPTVIGTGHHISQGVRAGAIIDMEAAVQVIGSAIESAEKTAGEQIDQVHVNLSGGHPASQTISVEVAISNSEVTETDLMRALRGQNQAPLGPDSEIVHAIPVSYIVDGARGISDPRGMYGERLGVDLHLVTAGSSAIRNLETCIRRCHLEVESLVSSAYAAGLACLVPDEMELGCTIIDMGAGTTTLAVFFEGKMVFTDTIPVGGAHVTNDLARGLTTKLTHAERMKTLFGSAMPSVADEREVIDVPQVGEEDEGHVNHVPKSLLTGIIQPRVEEIFELVRGRLEAGGFDKISGRRVVLCGGASQLQGVRELAQLVMDKQVRLGRPAGLDGLTDGISGPAFATTAGLLVSLSGQAMDIAEIGPVDDRRQGMWGRLGGWVREHL
ncbi:MAG: cell division protein FtsA [Pseudomonadota bacterium]